jgi:hypothetical protein
MDKAVRYAHRTVAFMKELGQIVCRPYNTAKCHDLFHIPWDILAFGKADNCDTGTVTVCCTFETVLHWLSLAVNHFAELEKRCYVGPYESRHKYPKRAFKASSKRRKTMEKELMTTLNLHEAATWQVSALKFLRIFRIRLICL